MSQGENLPARLDSDSSADTTEGQTLTHYKPKLKKPSMYKVLLLNDDYTPMDFVILILKRFFRKSEEEAAKIMLQVHQQGAGIAGVYTHEIAETKVYTVNEFSKANKHPLKCVMDEDSSQNGEE
ncbi:MAG: ATP-dependent Clp protease adapter ClpS [Bdellovibrionales bacterium]|nr:ATP-dependent Clp protease adapter ClpS [Bdellovibrionales bacterium]